MINVETVNKHLMASTIFFLTNIKQNCVGSLTCCYPIATNMLPTSDAAPQPQLSDIKNTQNHTLFGCVPWGDLIPSQILVPNEEKSILGILETNLSPQSPDIRCSMPCYDHD